LVIQQETFWWRNDFSQFHGRIFSVWACVSFIFGAYGEEQGFCEDLIG
jgi:hypothetical protein